MPGVQKKNYLFKIVVGGLHRGSLGGQSHQVPIRPQSLLARLGQGRFLLMVRGRGFLPNGTIARVAHLLKIMTHLIKKGVDKW